MGSAEARLIELGIVLPDAPNPVGSYVAAVRTGNLVYLSGMLPFRKGKLIRTGRVSESVTVEDAVEDARAAALNALAVVRSTAGSLDKIVRCIKITGFVASSPDFTGQPVVMNGASDLIAAVFGEAGRHARVAVGVSVLPLNSPVEMDFIFELSPD